MAGLYAPNGSINISEDTEGLGLYAPDGSWRVTVAPTDEPCGLYAPDGSLYINDGGNGRYGPNGAYNVSEETSNGGNLFVTFVTGGFPEE